MEVSRPIHSCISHASVKSKQTAFSRLPGPLISLEAQVSRLGLTVACRGHGSVIYLKAKFEVG